jgi:hypothetical protein
MFVKSQRLGVAAMRAAVMGIALTAALGAGSVALASAASPAAAGNFTKWSAAQHAAGFKLLQPGRSDGLHRSTPITVQKCLVGKHARNVVSVNYGGSADRSVSIQEVNYRLPCGNVGEAKVLGHYRMHGVRATLLGSCGLQGLPSCHKRKISLDVLWVSHGRSYGISCFAMRRGTVVAYARAMKKVS